jgi:hypothetical protein
MEREPEAREPIGDPDDDTGDFADEHEGVTVDNERGGPEGIPEDESPEGLGGPDY